jgi:transcriptional regulator with XRE-family HTH domain
MKNCSIIKLSRDNEVESTLIGEDIMKVEKVIGERLKQLRDGAKLSQMKIGDLNGVNQSNLARYENGKAIPPLSLLLWYADHFDVSMDFIFGRTDSPEGKSYAYDPKITADSEQLRQFINMCFDPDSLVSGKLKNTLLEMYLKEGIGEK